MARAGEWGFGDPAAEQLSIRLSVSGGMETCGTADESACDRSQDHQNGRKTPMNRLLTVACAAGAALMLVGCADGGYYHHDHGPMAVAYDGFYDDGYGPFYDGYWGDDGAFYYSDGPGHAYRRDDAHHFRHDNPGQGFHAVQGHPHGHDGDHH
jgi:hypothetical protein